MSGTAQRNDEVTERLTGLVLREPLRLRLARPALRSRSRC